MNIVRSSLSTLSHLSHLICRLMLFLIVLSAANNAARVIHVESSPSTASIHAAFQHALPFDTLEISSGVYKEATLNINKPITLIGKDWPVLTSDGSRDIVRITSDDVTVTGLVFTGVPPNYTRENAAIALDSVTNVRVHQNRFQDNFYALYLSHANHCWVTENEISHHEKELSRSGNGIHLWYSRDVTIGGNSVSGQRDGIYFEFATQCRIENNRSMRNLRYGLHFMYSDSCVYKRNEFTENGSGVAVMYTRHVDMFDNNFSASWGSSSYGLLLKDIKDSKVESNLFQSNSVGIQMEGSDRVSVRRNTFRENGWAIKITANCVNDTIMDNNFYDNSFLVSTNSRHHNSHFSRNFWSSFQGYDLDRDGFGDEAFRPVSLYSLLVESEPATLVFVHSLLVGALDFAERVFPKLTPESLVDSRPRIRPFNLDTTHDNL